MQLQNHNPLLVNRQEYLTFAQASRRCHFRPSISTIWRWARKGLKARSGRLIRLRHLRMGRRLVTTPQWLDEFFDHLAQADCEQTESSRDESDPARVKSNASRRQREIEVAEAALQQEGI